ncbi:MAG: cytochrome c biogenesis protein CcsA [Bradymonadaceae bacterium]
METFIHIATILLPIVWIGVFAFYARHFFREGRTPGQFVGSRLLHAGLALQAVYLAAVGLHTGHFPFTSRSEFLALLALSIAAIYAFDERRHGDADTGVFFVAIAALFQLASAILWTDPGVGPQSARDPIFGLHVLFTVFGFAGLTISALYALMYVLLSVQLKSGDLGVVFRRLPPLATLEEMSKLAAIAGVALLGVGLGLGHYVAVANFGTVDPLGHPAIIVADLAWLSYVGGLITAESRGLSGRRMGYLSLGGYLVFMISMVVVLSQSGTLHTFQ